MISTNGVKSIHNYAVYYSDTFYCKYNVMNGRSIEDKNSN